MANLKPASAHYAGSSFFRVHMRLMDAVHDMADAGRVAPFAARHSPAPSPAPEAAMNTPPVDSRLAKSFLDGSEARPGNLPDGRGAQLELELPLLSQYYTAREVDTRAVPLEEVPLFNPLMGPGSGKGAKVILLVLINENGGVDSVATLEARPRGVFDGMARAAFAAIRYSPALKGGKPVKSQKIVEIIYGS